MNQTVSEPAVVVSTGGRVSPRAALILTVSDRHTDQLPAASRIRVSSVCVPVPETSARSPGSPALTEPPSTRHSTASTPASASVPVTAAWYGLPTSTPGAGAVVLVGAVASTVTFSSCGADTLPATSRARVLSWYSPVVVKWTKLPEGPCSHGPPSICHSTRSTPDTASLALTSTWAACTQSSGASVRLVGTVVSILTVCCAQPDSLPASSRTSVWTVCSPSAEIVN